MCRFRRRRRVFHADGGVCYRGKISIADQSRHHQEQFLGTNQMGANGFSRQSRVWLRIAGDRLCRFARACGASGFTIERAFECGAILQEALATPGPVIVEAIVDPNEPPMPAKITLDQAKKLTESLIRGTPHRGQIALTVLSDKIKELI